MMPEWLQLAYGFVLVLLLPFCAWLASSVLKCRVDIAKVEVEIEALRDANALKVIEIDNRCKAEIEGRGIVTSSLNRLERNVVVIGSKMNLDLERPDE